MIQYKTDFLEWHGQGENREKLSEIDNVLNIRAQNGWVLKDIKQLSIGFLVIYEKQVP